MGAPQLHVQPPQDVGATAGALLVATLTDAVAARGRCTLGVAGGNSVLGVFSWLAEHLPDELARHLVLTWVDERHVPLPDSDDWRDLPADANQRGAWEAWLSKAPVLPTVVPMSKRGTIEQARAAYEADFLDRVGRVDAVLLGAGPDGHFASLFPDHPALTEPGPVLAIADSPKPPPTRLTLSLPVLTDVDRAVLVSVGAGKADMLGRAWRRETPLPLSLYEPAGAYDWVLDPAAAQELT